MSSSDSRGEVQVRQNGMLDFQNNFLIRPDNLQTRPKDTGLCIKLITQSKDSQQNKPDAQVLLTARDQVSDLSQELLQNQTLRATIKRHNIKVLKDYRTQQTVYKQKQQLKNDPNFQILQKNQQPVTDQQDGRIYHHLSKQMLEKCKDVGKALENSAFLNEYLPQFLQHMFEKQTAYFSTFQKMKIENLNINRRLWKTLEYCNWDIGPDISEHDNDQSLTKMNNDQDPYFYVDQIHRSQGESQYQTPKPLQWPVYQITKNYQNSIRAQSQGKQPSLNFNFFQNHYASLKSQKIKASQGGYKTVSKRQSSFFRKETPFASRKPDIQIDNQEKVKSSIKTSSNQEISHEITFNSSQFQINRSIKNFNQGLQILNTKIQVLLKHRQEQDYELLRHQRQMNRKFYKSLQTWSDKKYKTRIQTDGFFLQSSVALISFCQQFDLSQQTVFAANYLFYFFLKRHPQLLEDQFQFNSYFKKRQRQEFFFSQMIEYTIIAAISISSKYNETYHPGLVQIAQQINDSLSYEILTKIQAKMQTQLVLIEINLLRFDFQVKWLEFMGVILGWTDTRSLDSDKKPNRSKSQERITNKIQNKPKVHESNIIRNSVSSRNSISFRDIISSKKSKASFQEYNLKICEFILQTGLINMYLYDYPCSKKVGAVMTIYLKYWLKKNINSDMVKLIWSMTKLDSTTYAKLQAMYTLTLKYCDEKKIYSIKNKYFMNGINPKSIFKADLIIFQG